MADDARVEVHGLDELAWGTKSLARKIDDKTPAKFGRVAGRVRDDVAAQVPRKTGRLSRSVVSEIHGDEAVVGIGEGVPYAGWIEFGGTRGRPYVSQGRYLYPTAFAAEPLLVAAAEDLAHDEIEGMRWPKPS